MTITGGCLCGALRYTIEGDPEIVGKCYCRDCQKETGTGHMTFAAFPSGTVSVTGKASEFVRCGGSGSEVVRQFCPTCGTTILGKPSILGDIVVVRVGTIDDPADMTVSMAVYGDHAQPWDLPHSETKTFGLSPP